METLILNSIKHFFFFRALNYGSLGNVIGHEITHGYDNNGNFFIFCLNFFPILGRLHDGEGKVRDWWNNETEANFKTKKQCLIDQYNAIEIPNSDGIHVILYIFLNIDFF